MMEEGILVRDKCPVCNGTSSKSIFKRSFDEVLIKDYMNVAYQGNAKIGFLKGVNFQIVKCNYCHLLYQKIVLSEERLDELYNNWIDPKLAQEWNDNKLLKEDNLYSYIFEFVKKYLPLPTSEIKVLDYGAGFGNALILAKEMGFDCYSYEYSNERIKFLEKKGIKSINHNDGLLFDFIIVNQVLEHLTHPGEILKIVHSRLKTQGLTFIAVPNCNSIEEKLKKTDNIYDANKLHQALLNASVAAFQHINFFNNSNLKRLLLNHGLKPLNPIKHPLTKPVNLKSILRPFYWHFFRTTFFLTKRKV